MNTQTDYDKILKDVKEINVHHKNYQSKTDFKNMKFDEFQAEMEKRYSELNNSFNFIFIKAISGSLDNNVFTYMIEKAKSIQKNKISNFDASKQVGEKIVDTFIKPNIKKK